MKVSLGLIPLPGNIETITCYLFVSEFYLWLLQGKQGKHILYGCSELFNATQFIKQVKCVFHLLLLTYPKLL